MADIETDVKCYFAMRYWNPYTEEVLDQITRDGIDALVIVPLYPQYSISTSGSSLKLLQEIFYKNFTEIFSEYDRLDGLLWGPILE